MCNLINTQFILITRNLVGPKRLTTSYLRETLHTKLLFMSVNPDTTMSLAFSSAQEIHRHHGQGMANFLVPTQLWPRGSSERFSVDLHPINGLYRGVPFKRCRPRDTNTCVSEYVGVIASDIRMSTL